MAKTIPSITLQKNSNNNSLIKELQAGLIKLGYDLGASGADGDFGPMTFKAVSQFQLEHGLEADGVVGPLTWTSLYQELGYITSSAQSQTPTSNFTVGDAVKIKKDATFINGKKIPSYLFNMLVYVKSIGSNSIIISLFKAGAKLGEISPEYLELVKSQGNNTSVINTTTQEETATQVVSSSSGYTAEKLIQIALNEIGYHEKASNSNLDSKTANSGSSNWTKYARDLAEAGYYGGSSKNGFAWCFTQGTLILTNKGYKNIEDIRPGDKVLNAYGDKFNTVLFNEPHMDKVMDVRVYGALPFSATPDHPFLSQKRKDKYHRNKGYYNYGFNPISSLNRNDVCIIPKTQIEFENDLSYDELWTLGYYVGDGCCTNERYKVCGCERKAEIIRQHVDAREEKKYKSRTCIEFELHKTNHEKLFDLLAQCGKGAENKHIPPKILFGTKEVKKAFLDGYIAADGTKDLKFNSISYQLIAGITKLYNDLGYGCSINIQERPSQGQIWDEKINDYRTFNQHPYIINCSVNTAIDRMRQPYTIDENQIFVPLKEKSSELHEEEVWTITTDGDHTYLANNLAVHNCDVFADWCFYKMCGNREDAERLQCQSGTVGGAGCANSASYYKSAGQWSTSPQVGAQIFFYYSGDINHTGIVVDVQGSTITTVEGNSSDQVSKRTYSTSYGSIAGYGIPKYETQTSTPVAVNIKAKVTARKLNIRQSPNSTAAVIGMAREGDEYQIIQQEGTYGKLSIGGWVDLTYVEKI